MKHPLTDVFMSDMEKQLESGTAVGITDEQEERMTNMLLDDPEVPESIKDVLRKMNTGEMPTREAMEEAFNAMLTSSFTTTPDLATIFGPSGNT